ncbi:acyl-CoA carboxylase epsilon subunit [Streptomyces sp. GC420]|uniref:acyl-CoA carboxylase epsilon subunit n=1 Tax=Streptomyces sp. GC420 TaxID=2697568 RepID=UPI001FB660C4|nr:acyl-CoA carboxylase epsilon subunit [Streptomyces sp. GC420]
MNDLSVVRGSPSKEDLAAVLAVLLARQQSGGTAGPGGDADGTAGLPHRAGWARGRRSAHLPAGSWQHV